MNIVEKATEIATITIRGIRDRAVELGHSVSFEGEGVRVRSPGIFGSSTFKWGELCQMAMIAAVLDCEISIEMRGESINPTITGSAPRVDEVFLAVNTQIYNFLSQQPPIPSHVAMCRQAHNHVNDATPMFAEILNLYTDGTYYSARYPRDTFMYFYYLGQLEFQFFQAGDTFRVGLREDYDNQYVADRYQILENVTRRFIIRSSPTEVRAG